MGTKIIVNDNDIFGFWKVLEANIENPNTTAKAYIGRKVFSRCICTHCNQTERYIRNSELAHLQGMCRSCTIKARNIENRQVQVGNKYGKLTVIGDAGYKNRNDGKQRHFSICRCDCGNIVEVMDNSLQCGNTTSCGCVCSKGENKIKTILEQNNIIYDYDSIFPQLLQETNRRLRFDFIIYNKDGSLNRFIEFDGNQHKTGMWGGSWSNLETLEVIQERDEIKNTFCKQHNYILVRIPYNQIDKITLDTIIGEKFII